MDRVLEVFETSNEPMTIAEIAARVYLQPKGIHVVLALTDVGARVEYLHQRGRVIIANADEMEKEDCRAAQYGIPG